MVREAKKTRSKVPSRHLARRRSAKVETQEQKKNKLKSAAEFLQRWDELVSVLGRPTDMRSKMRYSLMKSAYNRLRQEFPDISLLDETSSFSGDEKLQVSLFRTLGQPEKEHVFYKLLISKNSSSDLEGLTNSYKDFIHNGAVDGSNSKNGRSGPSAFNAASRESRWAEENRPGVRFPMRLSNNLIDEIDAAAQAEGKTRTEWFVSTIERFLSQNSGRTPPDSPEYKSTRAIHIRLSEELNDRIVTASERSGLKKTEWARRVMRSELSSRSTNLDFSQEP